MEKIPAELASFRVAIDSLVLDPKNARKHSDRNLKAIARSLAEFGQRRLAIVQKKGMLVRAGNGMIEAAISLGWKEIAALVVDEVDAQAVKFAIADNRAAELAEWDEAALRYYAEQVTGLGTPFWTSGEMASILEQPDPILPPDEFPAIDEGAMNFAHTCPRCGFQFNG